MKKLFFVLTCLFLAIPCQARIITVDDNVPADFNNIQAAIDDSNDGDTIIVADGIFKGVGNRDIDFFGKAITLRSENGPENCIIDCNGTWTEYHRGFDFHSGEDANSIVDGFTITNGYTYDGGGIKCCYSSSPIISNCVIMRNSFNNNGGGIYCRDSSPMLTNCTFNDNWCQTGYIDPPEDLRGCGGAMCNYENSSPILINCTFSRNTCSIGGGGIVNYLGCNPTLTNCIFHDNWASFGGGILNYLSSPTLTNCTFSSNNATWGNGMLNLQISSPTLTNCILWDGGDEIQNDGSTITISYSDVQGGSTGIYLDPNSTLNWGVGNIDVDPCFVDAVNSDYHLKSQAGRWDPNTESWVTDANTSVAIDAGNPNSDWTAELWPHGKRINMGAYGGTPQASMSLSDAGNIADLNNDGSVDYMDIMLFTDKWPYRKTLLPEDFDRNGFVDFNDFSILGLQWSYPSAFEPGMSFHIDDCNMEEGLNWPVIAESNEPRFSVWVEGRYIHFEDMMYANCCPDELGLDKEINGNQITLYEIGYGGLCDCMCYFPITATLGPFEDGTYTVEVYDNYGQSLGVVEVTIGGSPEPGMTFQIGECSHFLAAEQVSETRFTVTVEGRHVHFEDTMTANCCPDELGLEMMVEDSLITIYETEYTPNGCRCMCNYPITATLGPFEPGAYTLDVYEDQGGFIGSTTVVIDPPP